MDQRMEFALQALRTDNFRALCSKYGISPNCNHNWGQTGKMGSDRLLSVGSCDPAEKFKCCCERARSSVRALYFFSDGAFAGWLRAAGVAVNTGTIIITAGVDELLASRSQLIEFGTGALGED